MGESAGIAASEATSSAADEVARLTQARAELPPPVSVGHTLPPPVLLSQGSNKYIVVRAVLPEGNNDGEHWFVRSATPEKCGGPYHANVAEVVLRQLGSLGYAATVVGGGRIDFVRNEDVSHAHVFGFSYGYGKGDHEKVAAIIERHTDVVATFDSSDGQY